MHLPLRAFVLAGTNPNGEPAKPKAKEAGVLGGVSDAGFSGPPGRIRRPFLAKLARFPALSHSAPSSACSDSSGGSSGFRDTPRIGSIHDPFRTWRGDTNGELPVGPSPAQ